MYKVMTIIKIWKYSVFSEKTSKFVYLALFMGIKGIILKGYIPPHVHMHS